MADTSAHGKVNGRRTNLDIASKSAATDPASNENRIRAFDSALGT
jgi:hypothetical protein